MTARQFCMVDSSFDNDGEGRAVFIAAFRRRPEQLLEVGGFLVDLGCVGIKDAFYTQIREWELETFKDDMFPQGCREVPPPWARKLLEDAQAYAHSLGIKTHRDYKKAARVLGGVRSSDCQELFHFGRDGKPFYIQGKDSDEKARRMVEHLQARLGEDGFHFIVEAATGLSDDLEERINFFLDELEAGRIKKATAGVEKLAEAHPGEAIVHFGLGAIAAAQDKNEEALACFDRAVELAPEREEAWFNKAVAHNKLIEPVAMIRAYQKVVELTAPEDDLHQRAADHIENFAEIMRESSGLSLEAFLDAETLFGEALKLYEDGEFDQAIQIISENPDRLPENERTLTLLGASYRNLKQWDLARSTLEKALEIEPDHYTALVNLKLLEVQEAGREISEELGIEVEESAPKRGES